MKFLSSAMRSLENFASSLAAMNKTTTLHLMM